LDEIGEFSLAYNNELESILGEEKAGEIEVEVSSPVGACCSLHQAYIAKPIHIHIAKLTYQ
jgi:hypothetical protein